MPKLRVGKGQSALLQLLIDVQEINVRHS